jgi:hypothetical protein
MKKIGYFLSLRTYTASLSEKNRNKTFWAFASVDVNAKFTVAQMEALGSYASRYRGIRTPLCPFRCSFAACLACWFGAVSRRPSPALRISSPPKTNTAEDEQLRRGTPPPHPTQFGGPRFGHTEDCVTRQRYEAPPSRGHSSLGIGSPTTGLASP